VKKNLISVLLPVYNAERFVAETLDSLIRQTNKNFEVIAINDGSTDDSLKVLQEYAKRDTRIKVIDQENQGLVKTLNTATKQSAGEFLARIDADDVALDRRFEFQLKAMEEDSDRVLIAGGFDVMNEDGEVLYHDAVPTNYEDIVNAMYTRNPIAHGSVLIRRSAFEAAGGYSEDCGPTEDYELWTRLSKIGTIVALPQTIFRWRVNPNGITSTKSDVMEKHMKVNFMKFQELHPFKLVTRAALKEKSAYYVNLDPLHGVSMKERVLQDLTNASFILLKQGRTSDAIRQLFIISSTGRTGLRLVRYRIMKAIKYHGNHLLFKTD
jgi:glycosyltransferase involved in cell wall biosynthesis